MTVEELVEILQNHPSTLIVTVKTNDDDYYEFEIFRDRDELFIEIIDV